jgi:hypothetical protein
MHHRHIAVLHIARLHWVKRRLNVGAQLAYHRHPDTPAITKAGEEGWQGVRNYLSVAAAKGQTPLTQVQALARAQFDTAKNVLALIHKISSGFSSWRISL